MNMSTTKVLGFLLAGVGFLAGCGDDGTGGTGAGGSDAGGNGAGGATGGGGASEGGGGALAGGGGAGGAAPIEAIALVRGQLFTTDMAEAKATHDAIASGGETAAKGAGNFAHDPYLGTLLLGTTENEFLSLDRWTSDANMDAFYSNPDFLAAFSTLFAAPPSLETFERAPFYQWGDLDAADGTTPHYAIVVRGHLADEPSVIQTQHDAIASGGEATAKGLGDVAHVVYLGRTDDREALLVDLWTSNDSIEAFYSNPDFQAAVGSLFDAPPTVGVYATSGFLSW
ncbi:MAG: hypothetical protein U0271_39125 [Polyangiaceae bacterium]